LSETQFLQRVNASISFVLGGDVRSSAYRGPDRRRRSPQLTATYSVPQLLLAGNLVAAVALGLPLLGAYLGSRELPPELLTGTLVLSSCLFACTGMLCLVGWRLVGFARSAYIGGCFAFFGILTTPLPLVGHLLPDAGQPGLSAPLARAAIALGAISLAARAGISTEIDSRVRPVRLLAQAGGITAACYTLFLLILHAVGTDNRQAMFRGTLTALALAWIALGTWFVRLALRGRQGMWSGCAILLMGGQAVLRVLSVDSPRTWMFPAGTLSLMAAGAALAGAGKGLIAVLGHQDRHLLRLSVDLQASEDQIAGERDRRQEELHDVRSALAAIRCANGTLHRYAERLDERTKATLVDALTKELGRLEGLVDPTISHPMIDFGLQELLGPLVATESMLGSEILLHVGDLAVHGRPVDTAAVVQNLLVNARRYAPGSVITVHAVQRDGRVEVQVEDSGPGIPERERAAVFERGVRGSTSVGVDGTGLGLFVSRRLMAEQHGSLRLRAGAAGGACFVFDLPAAVSDPVPSAPDVLELTDVDLRHPVRLEGTIFVPGQPKRQPGERVNLVRVHHHRDES
jgi:signal transduction histidine kinase